MLDTLLALALLCSVVANAVLCATVPYLVYRLWRADRKLEEAEGKLTQLDEVVTAWMEAAGLQPTGSRGDRGGMGSSSEANGRSPSSPRYTGVNNADWK